MLLTLNILRCPEDVAPESRQVSGGEFSIGRAPGNDWVLPDPERHLSKRHCVLAYRDGAWQLADTSTNGIFLNREQEPVGPRNLRTLRNGDRLRLGAYEIEVALLEAAQSPGWRSTTPSSNRADSPFDDPFASWSGAPDRAGRPSPGAFERTDDPFGPSSSVRLPENFDPLAEDSQDGPFGGPVQSDHTPALEDAFRPPRPTPALLPENWDADESLSGANALPTPSPETRQPPAPPPIAPVPVEERVIAEPERSGTGDSDLLAAFLSGAGLKTSPAPTDPVATMQALGEAFRAIVSGLRSVLVARASIKGEFRIEQTIVRARGNNPLKFSAGDDDALAAILGVGRHVDMSPAAAISEALRDIRSHELAVMGALQYGVRALLTQLEPAALQAAADHGGIGLPGQR
ncbi:MAG: type VI secretion system-associated FHA domain protein TagH, partial [Acetobacteraceae bacterium]|nr:type VI secretion system-associated FHA domain protein TagH [Acetobacteraceae bacterium]